MAKLITDAGRKAIKKMAQISQVARALSLMPKGDEFALRLIGDLVVVAKRVNSISTRMNDILDRYSSIPSEFLLRGFDEVLHSIDNVNDYAKFAISETANVMSSTVTSGEEMLEAIGNATSAVTSAVLQVGGGLTYGAVATSANLRLSLVGDGTRSIHGIREDAAKKVTKDVISGEISIENRDAEFTKITRDSVSLSDTATNAIRDWTKTTTKTSVEKVDEFFDNANEKIGFDDAQEWISETKDAADGYVDVGVNYLTENVEKAKNKVEDAIELARKEVDKIVKDVDNFLGFGMEDDGFSLISNHVGDTAREMGTETFDAVGELSDEVTKFISNFSIGKVVTALGGIVVGAGAATLAMDLLPSIDVDRMLKDIVGGVDTYRVDKMTELYHNKYYENAPDLLEVPDVPWLLSKDDLEKYNADGYEKYLEEFGDELDKERESIATKMANATTRAERAAIRKENRELMKENKSALKAMRKVRRDAIKAKQIEKYKGFLKIELDYLKRECLNIKYTLKNDWDLMMGQYKAAVLEIKRFFTDDGSGGSETIDRCCDRINEDAEKITEMCKSITVELTSAIAMIPTPYAVGTCVDMPVHKILAFFKDIKIIITFIRDLIRLGIDIISQLTILAKIVANGFQSLADILQTLKDLIGVDKILNLIDFLIALFRPKMVDAKILLENSISPVFYNETEDYENRVAALEAMLEDDKDGGNVEKFNVTDDEYAKKKDWEKNGFEKKQYGGKCSDDDEIEETLEALELKGDVEIVAYRSPILNDGGDDFAGWIFYHAHAYDHMKDGWTDRKKRRRDKVIKKASAKNKMRGGKLVGGVAQLKRNNKFGKYVDGKYKKNSVSGFDAYYWYTKWTNDPTDCEPDFNNGYAYDSEGNLVLTDQVNRNVVSPIQTTQNGSLVELSDGSRVFVEGQIVQSGDFVNVNGVKYRVK